MRHLLAALVVVAAAAGAGHAQTQASDALSRTSTTGILLLAHGGAESWNANVRDIAGELNREQPVEVAFGMATRANIQAAVSRLEARGATEIVAVPLFISTHSPIVRATEYLLGLRDEAPPELARFAKMAHGPAGGHAQHGEAEDGTRPIETRLPVRMTPALDDHPLVGAIAADRAKSISRSAAREAVILAAHGPVGDADNVRWLRDLRGIAAHLTGYASVDVISLRDDAPAAVRDAATATLRELVTKHRAAGHDVLIVPVLMSYGGIEKGLRTRLEGLEYRIPAQGLAPDARVVEWVKTVAR